jgi:hypothetical protein
VRRAALWGERPENAQAFCRLIAENLGGGVTPDMVAAVLGRNGSAPWLRLDADATALSGAQALWLYALIVACGQAEPSDAQAALAQKAFWPLDGAPPLPSAPAFFDGPFDPAHWRDAFPRPLLRML